MMENDRLRLRALSGEDTPWLETWENDPEGWHSSGTINPLSRDFIQQYITASSQHILETGCMGLIIERKEPSPLPIGHLTLYDYTPLHRRLALGLYIEPGYRQLGYGAEALQLATQYAFDHLRCEQVYTQILSANIHSQRMVERLGFQRTAILPRWYWSHGDYLDLYYYQKWNQ